MRSFLLASTTFLAVAVLCGPEANPAEPPATPLMPPREASILFYDGFEGPASIRVNRGATRGTVLFVEGKVGQSVLIADEGAYAVYPSANAVNPMQGTIEFWMNPTSAFFAPETNALFFTQGGFNRNNILVCQRGTTLTAMIYDDAGFWGGAGVPNSLMEPGKWHHVAVVWKLDDGAGTGFMKLYLDGQTHRFSETTAKRVGKIAELPHFSIGNWAVYKRSPACAAIDELRIWDRPIPPEEFLCNKAFARDAYQERIAQTEDQPIIQRLFLFRRDYWEGEERIRGYYRLRLLPAERAVRMRFVLTRDGVAPITREHGPLDAKEGYFDFRVPPLPAGKASLAISVRDSEGKTLGSAEWSLAVQPHGAVTRRKVHFRVDEPGGVSRESWPITVGVPFGKGMLRVQDVETHTRVLDAAGIEVPCQSRLTATWTDARRYARWVLFDFQGHVAAGEGGDFYVEFGSGVTRAAAAGRPLASVGPAGDIRIDTGPMTVTIPRDRPLFFRQVAVNGRAVCKPRHKDAQPAAPKGNAAAARDDAAAPPVAGELYLKVGAPARLAALLPRQHSYRVDRSSATYLAELCSSDSRVEVETAGPIRTVIKATGWYGADDGTRLFKYILRLYLHKNKTYVHGYHTIIATESEKYVYSMGLRLQGIGRPEKVVFGGGKDGPVSLDFALSVGELAQIQPTAERWRILQFARDGHVKSGSLWGVQRASGHRAPGWCAVTYPHNRLLAVIKDFWQENPKEITVSEDGVLDLGFVAGKSAKHMDLRAAPFVEEEHAGGDSQGVAKTTRFGLDFGAPQDSALRRHAGALLTDLAVWIDPEWLQETDPFWAPVARCTPTSEDPLKHAYSNYVRMYVPNQPHAPEVVHGLSRYGILNYGDRIHSMATRGWYNNEDYALPFGEWLGYLATGNRMLFDAVTAWTRHLVDVDTLNYTTGDPGLLGLQSRHKRLHWGQPGCVTHTYVDQSLLYYYLYGYERGADHAELIRQGQKVWNWFPDPGFYTPQTRFGAVSRDYGVNLRILMNAYRHFWDPELLVRAHDLWQGYAQGFTPDGEHVAGYFNVPRGVNLYTRYTRDPNAVRTVLTAKGPELCAVLCAELGPKKKLEQSLAQAEVDLANAVEATDVPWWALQFAPTAHCLNHVELIGAAELLRRKGQEIKPAHGKLLFSGNMDIVFLEPRDEEHAIRLQLWTDASHSAPDASAVLLDPNGKEILNRRFDTRALPKATHGHVLDLVVPEDGITGHYALRLKNFAAAYMGCWLTHAPAKRVYLVSIDEKREFNLGAFRGTRFFFYVPPDCARFRVIAKPGNRPDRYGFAICDSRKRVVAAKSWYHKNPETIEVGVTEDTRGSWWRIVYTGRKGLTFTWPEELPLLLTDSPEAGFIPAAAYLERCALATGNGEAGSRDDPDAMEE